MTRSVMIIAAAALTAFAACASSPESRQARGECVLSASDSAYLAGGPVFRECGVDTRAKAIANRLSHTPSAPATPPRPGDTCYTAEVEFVVGIDGRPEPQTMRLVRSNDRDLGQSLLHSAVGWRYSPARRDGVPVRQIVNERRSVALRVVVTSSSGGSRPARTALPPRCS